MKLPSLRSRADVTTKYRFFAYMIFRKLSKLQQKTYRSFFSAPNQNYMQNLEHFWQSSILSEKPTTPFPPNPSIHVHKDTDKIAHVCRNHCVHVYVVLVWSKFLLNHAAVGWAVSCSAFGLFYLFFFLVLSVSRPKLPLDQLSSPDDVIISQL